MRSCGKRSRAVDHGSIASEGRGLKTIDDPKKPLFLKELKKIWDNESSDLPWSKERYSSSNTLLIDDTPYKALLNPPNNAIFPHPYSVEHVDDDGFSSSINNSKPGGLKMAHSKFQMEPSEKKVEDSLAHQKDMDLVTDKSVAGLESKGEEVDATSPLLEVAQEVEVEAEEQVVPMKKGKGVATLNSAVSRERSAGVPTGELKERAEVGRQLVRGQRRNRGNPHCSRSGASHPSGEFKLPRMSKCFHCLGRGHYAREICDPPR
ncbi:hypothetical protein QJS10_CPA08g00526 [Acorus calamus]|uniref:FCP1 homology domain-containing protein n=1 Tax=Acorus calamus TaxID=4465 RepID=A0AAV9EBA3_ACOCL|nr:hypothetical protein QJS10_CPA08g00526 [Acorus calamus]